MLIKLLHCLVQADSNEQAKSETGDVQISLGYHEANSEQQIRSRQKWHNDQRRGDEYISEMTWDQQMRYISSCVSAVNAPEADRITLTHLLG
jgi:hypothetical protein